MRVIGVNARGLSKRKWQDLMVWRMTTIGGHKRVNLNKIITFQEYMTKRWMVPLLGSRLLQRWWRDWGCGHGAGARKWGGSCLLLNFLIYFLLPGFYSPHIFSVPPSVRWDTCLFLSRCILPLPCKLIPRLLINKVLKWKERKKIIKCRMINLTRRNTPKRSRDVSIICCLNNSNTMWRVKKAENNPHILNIVLFNIFSLREVALKL